MFDDVRRQDSDYYGSQYNYGHGQNHYPGYNKYGQPQAYSYEHSSSPANAGTFSREGLTDEQVPLNLRRHNKRRHLVLHSAALLLILLVVLLLDLDKDRVFSNILLTRATMIPAKCLVPVRLCKEVVLAPRSTACPVSKAGCLPHLNTRINRRSEDILNTVGWEM